MIVEAQNDFTQFLIQFAPYTDNITETNDRSCLIEYDDSISFVYAITLGKNSSIYNIFFVGELVDVEKTDPLINRTFVGALTYTGSFDTIDCDEGFTYSIQFVQNAFDHQEHLVITTDPLGLVAYGFSNLFTFSYTASSNTLIIHQNNSLSPSIAFLPFAVDFDGSRGVIAGFLDNGRNSRIKYSAIVILFSIDVLTAIATPISSWSYPTNGTTWQAGQTNAGADQYAAKFDMSVSIDPTATQVLVGIQSMNTVFLFSYTMTSLTFISSIDNGQGIGFGKGVAWLSYAPNSFAILVNVYSTAYIWSSSKIYMYKGVLNNTLTPISIFPNIQQPLYSYMSSVFLNIITTPNNLVLQDNYGNLFGILPAPSGYYSSTSGPSVEISPAFSSQLRCIPGTYKNETGLGRCWPCPEGTKNDGINITATTCVKCSVDTFCPFGSTSDSISNDMVSNVVQTIAYPESPDITGIDDILFFTLFSIGSTSRCVALSPVFWTLIVAGIVTGIAIVMLVMKYCIKHPKATANYNKLEKIFKQTDLIGTGELWIGGLASFCIIVLSISCIVFSAKYYSSYPVETAEPSTYTCDTTIRNAQFESSVLSSSIPASDEIQDIFNLLNNQAINLNVAFLNTVYNCSSDVIILTYLLGSTWLPILTTISCNFSNYILYYSALLPFRPITVQITLPIIYTISGIRVGLSGPGINKTSTKTLQPLGFSQTFSQNGRMLGQNVRIGLQLTKVVNDTSPLVNGDDEILSGIWTGSFTVNYYESFFSDTDYLNAPVMTSTNVTLTITETPYYILNEQSPITRLPEIIYHDFLFITMIIGMFALLFAIVKLMIIPLIVFLIRKCKPNSCKNNQVSADDDLENPTADTNDPEHNEHKKQIFTTDDVVPIQIPTPTATRKPYRKRLPPLRFETDDNRTYQKITEK